MGSNKLLYIGLIVALVVAGGYFLFFRGDDIGPALSTSSDGQALTDSAKADREFLVLLQQLSSIQLDASLLQDPVFNSLESFRADLVQQPVGRSNPFAPVGR